MPALPEVIAALDRRFSPERIRVAILAPDQHGVMREDLLTLLDAIDSPTCEVFCIDARDRTKNGLLLADTFDFA